jgi:hypothetical protein
MKNKIGELFALSKKGLPLGMLAILMSAFAPHSGSAQIAVDQSNLTLDHFILNSTYTSSNYFSQSFIPTASNVAGGFVEVYSNTYPYTVTLTLWDVNPYLDNSNPLATGSTTFSTGGGVSVYWTPVAVTPGNTYFLQLSTTGQIQQIDYSTNDQYANGVLYVDNTPWWGGGLTGPDLVFKTYADVTPVPEPATYAALAGLAAFGLVVARRCHVRNG